MVESLDTDPLLTPGPHSPLQHTARAEEALRASELKYRALYNSLDEGFFLIDVIFDEQDRPVDLLYLESNAAATRMLGQDWAGKRLSEIGSGFEPYWLEIFGRVARTGQSVREERFAAPLGVWFDFYVFKMGGSESRRIGNTFRDITERKKSEEELRLTAEQLRRSTAQLRAGAEELRETTRALRESREWLRVTLSSIGDAVIATDTEGRVTFLNPVAAALTGWPADEATGQPLASIFRIINEQTRAPGEDIVGRVLRQGRVVALANHTALLTRDGREIPIEDSAAPILDESGAVRGVVLVFHDVTEERRAEETLRASEERYRSLADNSPSVLMRFDRRHRVVYLSPRAEEATGVPVAEFLGKTNQEVGMPDDLCALWDRAMDEVFETGEVREMEFDIQSPTGPRTFWLKLAPERGADGSVAHALGVSTDITERKWAEQALARQQRILDTVVQTVPDAINLMRGDDLRIELINPAYQGLSPWREFPGKTLDEAWPELAYGFAPLCRRVLETGEPHMAIDEPFALRCAPDGPAEERWFSWALYPIELPGAQGRGVLNIAWETTERVKAQEALRQSAQALQEANTTLEQRVAERTARLRKLTLEITRVEERERRRLAQVLHDHLQQLLAAARLSLTMVRNRRVDEQRQAEILAQIDELLGESIAESRSLTAELSPPVLYDAGLAAALEWLARWIEQKHHLRVQVDTGEVGRGEIPEGIRLVLFQGARELLFNVAKHAGVDHARVELRRLPGSQIELAVSDGGAGFDPAKLARQSSGGYGLFSIRERLESLGGQMSVSSTPGTGARVVLRVPEQPGMGEMIAEAADREIVLPPGAKPLPREAALGEQRARVLLVDDHTIMRQGLAYLLAEEPDLYLVGQAANGQEAVELACTMQPDVVLMDVTMPVMDGIEATRLITRQLPGVAVIGLSMHDGAEVARRMREAGAMAHVPKGGDPTELIATIRRCTKRS